MRQIRRGCFETNSSSTHSISIRNTLSEVDKDKLTVSDDGYIHVELLEFGWEFEDYDDAYTKLSYCIVMICILNNIDCWFYRGDEDLNFSKLRSELDKCKDFIKLENEIIAETGCKGIYVDNNEDGGYIDHQSCEYGNMKNFFNTWGIKSYSDFIFNKGAVLHTGNDNG